jgi:DNA-directed RNA polymerase specialized sigma24 family protein
VEFTDASDARDPYGRVETRAKSGQQKDRPSHTRWEPVMKVLFDNESLSFETLRRLSPEHRQVLLECHCRRSSVAEAAARLGVSAGTVKSRTHYALRAIRLTLEELEAARSAARHPRVGKAL